MDYLLGFGSTHRVLKAEAVLKEASVDFRLMPPPKVLAKYCDLVILIRGENLARAEEALKNSGIEPRSIYRKEGEEYVKV